MSRAESDESESIVQVRDGRVFIRRRRRSQGRPGLPSPKGWTGVEVVSVYV
jgi:hypothetical protein